MSNSSFNNGEIEEKINEDNIIMNTDNQNILNIDDEKDIRNKNKNYLIDNKVSICISSKIII